MKICFLGSPYLCRQLTGINGIVETKWASQNCILTYETIGIWPETTADYDVICTAKHQNLLVVGSSTGSVQLFNYPASSFFVSFFIDRLIRNIFYF